MSQHTRNQQSEEQRTQGRGIPDNNERSRYEGFEGMNYEQVRQPYNPKGGGSPDTNDPASNGNSNSKEE